VLRVREVWMERGREVGESEVYEREILMEEVGGRL
jgi:hypothetical protein